MRAIRLTFDVEGGKAKLRSTQRLTMRVPPEQRIRDMGEGSGVWIELRDADGRPLYRRVVDSGPFESDAEIVTGDPDQPLARRRIEGRRSVFIAVVPDEPRAASVHILRREPGGKKKPEEVAGVSLGRD